MEQHNDREERFLRIAAPILNELGFSSPRELIKEQLRLMIEARISRYEAEDRSFAAKYGKSFDTFASDCARGPELFEHEDDLNDWRFSREALFHYRARLSEIENA
uniref:Uncharacterized protein n=1 Tax=Geobacter metallireducens TaxID=28232 RepID=A0A831UC22_GEOME